MINGLKISELDEIDSITGREMYPVARGGNNFRIDMDSLREWVASQLEFRTGKDGVEFRVSPTSEWALALSYGDLAAKIGDVTYRVMSEDDYQKLVDEGKVDPDLIYYTYEDDTV